MAAANRLIPTSIQPPGICSPAVVGVEVPMPEPKRSRASAAATQKTATMANQTRQRKRSVPIKYMAQKIGNL